MGALIAEEHLNKVMSYVEIARETATILTGGRRPELPHPLTRATSWSPRWWWT